MHAAPNHGSALAGRPSVTRVGRPLGGSIYPPRHDRAGAELRRYDLALGICLAVGVSLAFILGLHIAAGEPPQGKDALIWAALLGSVWAVIAGGFALRKFGRQAAAIGLLSLLAGPVAVLGLALAPIAIVALVSAVSAPAAFRDWVGPDLHERLRAWAITLAVIGALVPASMLTRRLGRHVLGYGVVVGALAMISVVLIGIAGGFLFRGVA